MNHSGKNTFGKNERLCSRTIINELFESGKTDYFPLFRVVWDIKTLNSTSLAQVAFSVPKRGFKKAVARNLIKRRLREAYRLNKHALYEILNQKGVNIAFIIIYRGQHIPEFSEAEKGIIDVLRKLAQQVIVNRT